ncbi:MAG TPA: hypothetical protein EYQ50_23640 [Verrucomicrobiales bacterium]|nr:hypothetical protein [Verrucomicrobiales bacterium]HIL68595.1 hypothetical protein [Verrucomicrobiota bacterium]
MCYPSGANKTTQNLFWEHVFTSERSKSYEILGSFVGLDPKENEFSLEKYLRLFSVYHADNDTKFWIITEADRSYTTVLLPSDY